MRIRVDNGKYTFVKNRLAIDILRHGEAWHSQQEAFKALSSIMAELDAARVVLKAARALGDAAPDEIREALNIHAALVDDREAPSDWARPACACAGGDFGGHDLDCDRRTA